MSSRGAEWNKWDLHVHTPSSVLCYKDKSVSNQEIVDAMADNGISVFAVTDHHVIDIARFNDIKSRASSKDITVLPGIEFLSETRGREPVHFIGIFSESADISFVHDKIKNSECTKIAEAIHEGKNLDQVYCKLEETIELIHSLGGIVTIHAGAKSNSIENITNSLPHAVAQKTSIAESVDIYELGKESDQQGYREIVFRAINKTIPMVICSDNHDAKNYSVKQNLWIKGSCNFDGLKYALNEPNERFFIGEEPPILSRVRDNRTKYIREINIKRTGIEDSQQIWFEECTIPLSKELTTIIGNKGSGKSALSDILSFCADSDHSLDYTFLVKGKFKKKGFADRFSAQIVFENDSRTDFKELIEPVDTTNVPRVTYLPQSYFEKVCNEIGKIEAFRAEIEKVVFQYVPEHEKLEKDSFQELVDYKKQSLESEIRSLCEKISSLNNEIIQLEDFISPDHQARMANKIKLKREELETHLESKPAEVASPDTQNDDPETVERKKTLEKLIEDKKRTEKLIADAEEEANQAAVKEEALSLFKKDVQVKISELKGMIEKHSEAASNLKIDLKAIVTIEFDEHAIDKMIKFERDKKSKLLDTIGEYDPDDEAIQAKGLLKELADFNDKIKHLESQFSKKEQEYQKYIAALKNWEDKKIEIEGTVETQGSLNYLKDHTLKIQNEFPAQLLKLRGERVQLAAEIFEIRHEIKRIYDSTKKGIDSQLSKNKVTELKIVSNFSPKNDFEEKLLSHILQNKSGSFYGSVDGGRLLNDDILSQVDWNNIEGIKIFLNNIISYLEIDKRKTAKTYNEETFIGNIVKDRAKFYKYIFELDYLIEHYDLQQNGKSLDKLSPGEKGALLLVFYLMLDKDDIPLIIDQPEDNLDNKSVAEVLVPFIKEAKQRRQIIMVTHNPNLAVVADSEQVIRVNIEKENGNAFTFSSGGIEKSSINSQIVDVLEGTLPAFTVRKNKYVEIA